jgi:hypothetical protein
MKMKKLFVLSLLLSVGIFLKGSSAFAATKTWIGTTCTASSDCNWSTTGNWQGGVAPTTGDDVVINGDTSVKSLTTQDITSLSIASITTSGYDPISTGDGFVTIDNTAGLTITGNVTHNAPSIAPPSGYTKQDSLNINGAVTLGANSIFTNAVTSYSSGDSIALGGHTLSFVANSLYSDAQSTMSIDTPISGSGTVNYAIPTSVVLFLTNGNTYSGTTNINTVDYVTVLGGLTNAFGSSTINISSSARVLFSADGAQTINNPINITPPTVTGTFLENQIEFWADTTAVTYTVPNITLLGNARLGVNEIAGTVQVNLAGITTNGHCIQYGNENYNAGNFTNGPAACVVNVAGTTPVVPKTPNTGFGLIMNNPAATLAGTAVAAFGIYAVSRRVSRKTR